MSSILLITDAWTPQINGVVTTLTNVVKKCRELGHTVTVFSANNCKRRVPVYFPFVFVLPFSLVIKQ